MRLLESTATRQRRRAGMAVSVVVHTAAIGLAVVATARARVPEARPVEPLIYVAPTSAPAPVPTRAAPASPSSAPPSPSPVAPLPLPDLAHVPDAIPAPGQAIDALVDPARGLFDATRRLSDVVGTGVGSTPPGSGGSPFAAAEVERQVALVGAPPRPRYPEALRHAGVEGRVVVRFVVDSAGRVERGSVAVASSSHALFVAAVEPLVGGLRFRPAEAGGRRVRQLVEMPFEFVLGAR